jgi:hypothetical protein
MKSLIGLALVVVWLLFGVVLTACTDEVGGDYYENDIHHGYPGPGTETPNSQ